MSLSPDARVLLTEALQPPPGYTVDVAVGTTYSLDLTALLLAPMSFALFDQANTEDLEGIDPIRVLDPVRRHAERTTVFCQAGAIAVPSNYRSILVLTEGSVQEVETPTGLFHPKMWALRFIRDDQVLHRVVIFSRNFTFDRSWDTALVLEEAPSGTIDAAPAAEFLCTLPGLGTRPLAAIRAEQLSSLADSLRHVRLGAPEGFTGGELLPMCEGFSRPWPFPDSADRMLVISPFVSATMLDRLASITTDRTLLSRPESLEDRGTRGLRGWDAQVLQSDAEGLDEREGDSFLSPPRGLHAKTIITDTADGLSQVVTGSANLTVAAWERNAEFGVVLTGPTANVGVIATLDGHGAGASGLRKLLEPYTPTQQEPRNDDGDLGWRIEDFHRRLAGATPELEIETTSEDTVLATMRIELEASDLIAATRVWPVTLTADVHAQPLGPVREWAHATENITPYLVVETSIGSGEREVRRACLLRADLTGDVPQDRESDAVLSILRSRTDVLRYLVFLLGDPTYEAMLSAFSGDPTGWNTQAASGRYLNIALFEPLVRAVGHDTAALGQIATLITQLRAADEKRPETAESLIPEGLDELWDIVWEAHSAQVHND